MPQLSTYGPAIGNTHCTYDGQTELMQLRHNMNPTDEEYVTGQLGQLSLASLRGR